MVDAVHLRAGVNAASPATAAAPTRHRARGFQQALAQALAAPSSAVPLRSNIVRAVARVPMREKQTAALPTQATDALRQAMVAEGVPASWEDDLAFIMAQESGGRVNARNPVHSARGLYQLTAAHYHLNPRGAASFGNAKEEAQGGIRYIRNRYGTAGNAVTFWRQHHWY